MTRLFAWVGPFAPVAVFLLAAAESAAFVGFVIPGEIAVILGGVAAGTGSVPLWAMIVAAVGGAVIGDSIGYRVGDRLGPTLLARPRMARFTSKLEYASNIVSERGWWALVVARFAAVLRAVVPFAAGLAKMPYRRFLLGNAIGGVIWGTAFTLVGFVAGAQYPRVERWFRAGGLAIVVLLGLLSGIVWATRWVQRNRDVVAARVERLLIHRPFSLVVAGIRRANRPVVTLALTAAAIIGGGWVFGALMQDVIGSDEFFFFDLGGIRYMDQNRVEPLIAAARAVNRLANPVLLLIVGGLFGVFMIVRGYRRTAAAIAVGVVGQWLIVELTSAVINRVPPAVTPLVTRLDYGFPSEHVGLVAALVFVAAWPWDRPGWKRGVFRFGAAALLALMAGAARVVLLVEYPSDVIAAASVAAAWALTVCLAFDPGSPVSPVSDPG